MYTTTTTITIATGRSFYVCARPDGHLPQGRCHFFKWITSYRGQQDDNQGGGGGGGGRGGRKRIRVTNA